MGGCEDGSMYSIVFAHHFQSRLYLKRCFFLTLKNVLLCSNIMYMKCLFFYKLQKALVTCGASTRFKELCITILWTLIVFLVKERVFHGLRTLICLQNHSIHFSFCGCENSIRSSVIFLLFSSVSNGFRSKWNINQ